MRTHEEAISALGFVHRRLPTADPRNGTHAVPRDQYGQDIPSVLVVFDDDATRVQFCVEGEWCSMEFTPNTPGVVVNQAVASAMQEAQ